MNTLIVYITKGAVTSQASSIKGAVFEAIANINKSKILGKTVGAWFSKNYKTIIEFRGRKTASPSSSPKPPEATMTPSQLKKIKDEQAAQITSSSKLKAASLNSVATKKNEAFFWSGRSTAADGKIVGGAERAAEIANASKGTTLETIIEQRKIKMPDWDPNNPASVKAWRDISEQYAANASGEIRAVIGQQLRPGNIWETRELPALMRNPNITKITTIDPATGKSAIIWP